MGHLQSEKVFRFGTERPLVQIQSPRQKQKRFARLSAKQGASPPPRSVDAVEPRNISGVPDWSAALAEVVEMLGQAWEGAR
jgi:hypothetical protein